MLLSSAQGQDKDCFVITTNVDHCFQKAGFDKKRLFYTQEMERQAICISADKLTPELEKNLADCYRNTLDMCLENGLKSVAFCCISTGVFHFPNKRAAEIAVNTVSDWMNEHPGEMERVIFNVFKDEDRDIYEKLFARIGTEVEA